MASTLCSFARSVLVVVRRTNTDKWEVKSFDFLPIILSMGGTRAELRTALFAMAEVTWEDQNGISHDAPARFEDRSASGACIRVKAPINVGSMVKIKSRWEAFSGVAKYCRPDGGEYLLGVQKHCSDHLQSSPVPTNPLRENAASNVRPLSVDRIQSGPKPQESNSKE